MNKLRIITMPYSLKDTTGVIWRNIAGPHAWNRTAAPHALPHVHCLNPIVHVAYRIAFLGDLMSVGSHSLVIDESIATFLDGCDALVANLEATITPQRRRRGVLFGALQWQDAHVVRVLAQIFPPTDTYMSVANNHAGDFERYHFLQSCALLEEHGFHLFGQTDRPHADIGGRIRVHAGTMWTNQICDHIRWLGADQGTVDTRWTNILFPHWGYELELSPRPHIVNMASEYGLRYDAILGHHPHTVQPVTMERIGDRNRLIAYSLGDFCSDIRRKAYRFGILAKLEVGPVPSGDYRIGTVHWRFVECRRAKRTVTVGLADHVPYLTP